MRAPRLRGQEAEADDGGGEAVEVEMCVFWDLGSSRDLASLVGGSSGRVEALRQLGYDEQEVQDLIKIEPYVGSPDPDLDPDRAARGDGGDDGSNPARRLATAASNLVKTMSEWYSGGSGGGGSRRSLLVFGEREAFDEVWK